MNYEKLYFAFIEKYKNQEIEAGVYTEKHHIIPRHAGGDDSKENLVRLTYRQHTFAHRLLWKAYKKSQDLCAWLLMSGQEVDKKQANLRAIGLANYKSGLLDKIRHLANNDRQQEHASRMAKERVSSGELERARLAANEAWRGSKHTQEWKENKAEQMKDFYEKNPDKFDELLNFGKIGRQIRTETSEKRSKELIENAERNEEFLQETSSRSLYVFISPEGLEFDSPIFAAKYYCSEIKPYIVENWCKRSKYGWSRKPKAA